MKKKILIVDDEPMIREVLKEAFEVFGFHATEASSGHEAFKLILEAGNFDCILSDVRMPEGDGLELARNIFNIPGEKPKFFLVTGFSEVNFEKAKEWGVLEIFEKPFDIRKIIRIIESFLVTGPKSGPDLIQNNKT